MTVPPYLFLMICSITHAMPRATAMMIRATFSFILSPANEKAGMSFNPYPPLVLVSSDAPLAVPHGRQTTHVALPSVWGELP